MARFVALAVLMAACLACGASAQQQGPGLTVEQAASILSGTRPRAIVSPVLNPKSSMKALVDNKLIGFARIANASGLTPALNSTALKATIFAPTDEAIAKLAARLDTTPEALLKNQMLVDRLAGYAIVVNKSLPAAALKTGPLTMARGRLNVSVENGAVTLNGIQNSAKVVKPDIIAGNVTIHAIDNVLLPGDVFVNIQDAVKFRNWTSGLAKYLEAHPDLAKAIADPRTNITLLAPTNDAFKALLAQPGYKAKLANITELGMLLQYHAIEGAHILPNSVKATESVPTLLKGHNLNIKKVKNAKNIGSIYITSDVKGSKPVKVEYLNIIAGDSMIHLVNGSLVPAPLAKN